MDIDSGDLHLDEDREGELLVNSPCGFNRYLDRPEATAKEFCEHEGQQWFKTGDAAMYSSEHKSFKILGRLSQDIIKKSGYKISALEIEDVLLRHEDVKEVAVVSIPDETYGEEIVAFVVPWK
jgi:acyl-CoA synthetase (AMP-forming)/AMP-acid ligase II